MRLRFSAGNGSLSYGEFLQALAEDQNFRELIQDEMRAAPYVAFRWETPPLTSNNLDQTFVCLLHDSPGLDVPANPTDFEPYFRPSEEIVTFDNLGGDALLIAPCPISKTANYRSDGCSAAFPGAKVAPSRGRFLKTMLKTCVNRKACKLQPEGKIFTKADNGDIVP